MRPESGHDNRAAVAIVARVVDVLEAGRKINSPPYVRCVIGLDNIFTTVGKAAVAEKKTKSTRRKVVLVILLNGVADESYAGSILLATPPRALRSHALGKRLIDFGVGEGFRPAVVPSEARKSGEVVREILLKVDSETILPRNVPRVGSNVGRRILLSSLNHLIAVDPHVGGVGVGQQADDACFLRDQAATQFVFDSFLHGLATVSRQDRCRWRPWA